MYFSFINCPSQTLPRSTLTPCPPCVSVLFPHQDHFVLPKYSWTCDFPLEHSRHIRCLEKTDPFPAAKMANSSLAGVCGFMFRSPLHTGLLVWLVYDVTTTGGPYVQLPCSILKIPLSYKHSWPLALTLFLLPLLQWLLSLGGGVQYMFHLGLKILEPFTWPVWGLVNQHLLPH